MSGIRAARASHPHPTTVDRVAGATAIAAVPITRGMIVVLDFRTGSELKVRPRSA